MGAKIFADGIPAQPLECLSLHRNIPPQNAQSLNLGLYQHESSLRQYDHAGRANPGGLIADKLVA